MGTGYGGVIFFNGFAFSVMLFYILSVKPVRLRAKGEESSVTPLGKLKIVFIVMRMGVAHK